ncbi:hypothetical protein FORC55_1066 [Vibrio cholerae]|nr:hypothetical protein FORC55_1066 [Vibrio cholerae]
MDCSLNLQAVSSPSAVSNAHGSQSGVGSVMMAVLSQRLHCIEVSPIPLCNLAR